MTDSTGPDAEEPDFPGLADLVDALVEASASRDGAMRLSLLAALQDLVDSQDDTEWAVQVAGVRAQAGLLEWWPGDREPPPGVAELIDDLERWLTANHEELISGELLMYRASIDRSTGDLAAAETRLLAAERRLSRHPEIAGGVSAHNLGMLRLAQDRPAEAADLFEQAVARSALADLRQARAESLARLAEVRAGLAEHEPAARSFASAAAAFEQLGETEMVTDCRAGGADQLSLAATEALKRGHNREALGLWTDARRIYLGTGHLLVAADMARCLGIAASALRDDVTAVEWFRTAQRELAGSQDQARIGAVTFAWGNHAVARGDVVTAEPLLRSARAALLAAGNQEAAAACLTLLSATTFFRGDRQDADTAARVAAAESDDPEIAVLALAQAAMALTEQGRHLEAAERFAELCDRCLDAGLPARAVGATLGQLQALVSAGRLADAETLLPRAEHLLAEAAEDPVHGSLAGTGPAALAMMRAMLARRRGDPDRARLELLRAHEVLLRQGSSMLAARTAVEIAELELSTGRPREATWFAVPALLAMDLLRAALPSSRERQSWQLSTADAARVAFESAAATGDRTLLAELLEVVRGQGIPEPVGADQPQLRSLDSLLADAALRGPVPEQGTSLAAAAQVRMPWTTTALSRFLPTAGSYGVVGADRVAGLVVPR